MGNIRLAKLTQDLIHCEDPVLAIWDYLKTLWRPDEESEDTYFKQGEERTMYLEQVLGKAYPELYTSILPERCAQANLDPNIIEVPIIWMDALSLREALLLCRDLKGTCELSFAYSCLPSETVFYKEKVFEPWDVKKRTLKNVIGQLPLDGDERGVWCPIPDKELEDIRGRVAVRSQTEIYEKAKTVLESIMDSLNGDEFLVTSDHGYISTRTHFFPVPPNIKRSMKHIFGGSRYEEVKTQAPDLVERGLIVRHGDHYVVNNRYAWPTRGKSKMILHGGISLLECLVPVLRVAR